MRCRMPYASSMHELRTMGAVPHRRWEPGPRRLTVDAHSLALGHREWKCRRREWSRNGQGWKCVSGTGGTAVSPALDSATLRLGVATWPHEWSPTLSPLVSVIANCAMTTAQLLENFAHGRTKRSPHHSPLWRSCCTSTAPVTTTDRQARVLSVIANVIDVNPSTIQPERLLVEYGLDSAR